MLGKRSELSPVASSTAQKADDAIIFDPANDAAAKTNGPIKTIIVIGSGPVGMRFVNDVCRKKPAARIKLFGNEPFEPYNRVQLSALLAGEVERSAIDLPLPSETAHPNFEFIISAIRKISLSLKRVYDANGGEHNFDELVIATGARAHVPNIPGVNQTGVYTFRNLKDTEFLYARIARSRHTVVLGGGLLGLEAAKALLKHSTQVTLVQQGPRVMNRQLDDTAAGSLRAKVESLGIRVVTDSGVREIYGADKGDREIKGTVTGVRTFSGEEIECDTVVICAGIKPNIEIARDAGLKVSKGILVDDQLQTSHPDVYAIGECCEHEGLTYGLVSPGYEQASVAADVLTQGTSKYQGSLFISRLKVVGESVCSMGQIDDFPKHSAITELKYRDKKNNLYRKLLLRRGHIVGGVGYGEWPELPRVQEQFQCGKYIWPWQRLFFLLSGRLWASQVSEKVSQWRDEAIVCQCNSVSKGTLDIAIASGCETSEALQQSTGAGTVCGSCKPLLGELLGSTEPAGKELGWAPLLALSFVGLAVALYFAITPSAQVSDSFEAIGWFEHIWNDKYWKKVTGFTMLGMAIVSLLMSLRKRLKYSWLGQFGYWRLMHTFLGVSCTALLIFHTGFHFGSNLNQILMINFLGILLLGAGTGAVVSLSHKMSPAAAKKTRKIWSWTHILFTWPLPALIAAHILTVYYF